MKKISKKKIVINIVLVFLILLTILFYLIPETYDYIYGYFLFRKIGSNLTINIKDDFNKAVSVAYWAFDNLRDYPFMPVIDDNFLNIYRRGFGTCDQQAHVYSTIMCWLGFETKLLMLKKKDGTSPHTVSLVKVNGKFMIVDVLYEFIFQDKSIPVGIDELRGSEVFNRYLKIYPEAKPSWFEDGIYFETFPYADRGYIFKKVIQKNWQ